MFNKCLQRVKIPKEWKTAKIALMYLIEVNQTAATVGELL